MSFGFSGGQATCRDNEGIVVPSLNSDTTSPFILDIFCRASGLIKERLPFVWGAMGKGRLQQFAQQVHCSNIIEGITITVTQFAHYKTHDETKVNNLHLCGMHEDEKNSLVFPGVVVFSKLIAVTPLSTWRGTVIAYQRKSVDDAIVRKSTTEGPSLRHVMECYHSFPKKRKLVRAMLQDLDWVPVTETVGKIPLLQIPCHLNACVFPSPLIHYIVKLVSKFQLNYIEVMAIVRCQCLTPHSNYFLCLELTNLLQLDRLPTTGLDLGFFIIERMFDSATLLASTKGQTIPGMRFSKYMPTEKVSYGQFCDQTTAMVFHGLTSLSHGESGYNAVEKSEYYSKFCIKFSGYLPNCGHLITNHILLLMSILGLVPLWFAGEFAGSPTAKGFVYLRHACGLKTGKEPMQH